MARNANKSRHATAAAGAVCDGVCEPAPAPAAPFGGNGTAHGPRHGGRHARPRAGGAPAGGPEAGRARVRGVVDGQGGPALPVVLDHIAPDLRGLAFPVAELTTDPANARQHADAAVAALVESLRLHGQQKPAVAKRQYRGASNVILAGNGALLAARALGWSHLAVSWLPDEVPDDAAADYAVRDNRTAELSEWSPEKLRGLAHDGLDLRALWHDDADLDALLDVPVSGADWSAAFAALPDADREPIRQATFTLSDRQHEVVTRAVAAAKRLGPFEDPDNENANGCALHRIAAVFLAAHGEAVS